MAGRSPAGPLMREHRVIERTIAVLQAALEAMRHEGRVDPEFIDTATDFIRTYADRCHHGKEEDILFRALVDKDLDPELAGVMQDLVNDHAHARVLTGRLVKANSRYLAGDEGALAEIESAIEALVRLYPPHIEKEDRHFFKPAIEYLSAAEREKMLADYDEFDRSLIHERYLQVAEKLEEAVRDQQ